MNKNYPVGMIKNKNQVLGSFKAWRKLQNLLVKRFEVVTRLTPNPYETIYQYDIYDNDSKQKICSMPTMKEAVEIVSAWNMGE